MNRPDFLTRPHAWNSTPRQALSPAQYGSAITFHKRKSRTAAALREVAKWLGWALALVVLLGAIHH